MAIGTVAARLFGALGLVLALNFAPGQIRAQSVEQPPLLPLVDANGVNLATGNLSLPGLDVAVPGMARQSQNVFVAATRTISDVDSFSNSWTISSEAFAMNGLATNYYANVSYGGSVSRFWLGAGPTGGTPFYQPSPYKNMGQSGARFDCAGTDDQVKGAAVVARTGSCTLTLKDGTVANYVSGNFTNATKPDGETITTVAVGAGQIARVSSLGWAIKKTYTGAIVTSVAAFNTSVAPCVVGNCSPPADAPVSTKNNGSPVTIQRNGMAIGSYAISGDTITITSPSGVVKTVTLYPTTDTARSGKVWKVNIGGSTWTYVPNVGVMTITAPNGTSRTVSAAGAKVLYLIDEAGRYTRYSYDVDTDRVSKVVDPDGDANTGGFKYWEYNTSGDVTKVYVVPKNSTTGGAYAIAAAMVTSMTYNGCTATTLASCHKPTSVTDPNGIVTYYTYDTTTGLVTSQYQAAVNGVTPKTVYFYATQTPKAKDASGNLISQPAVTRLVRTSTCMSSDWNGTACAGGNTDEARSTIAYGTNNVLPEFSTTSRGDGTLAQTTQTTYDDYGRMLVVDGPKAGPVDELYTFYDAQGRQTGVVGMDPDGTGARHRQAQKTYYDADWHVSEVDTGIVGAATSGTGYSGGTALARWAQAQTDLAPMVPASAQVQARDRNEFDAYGRPTIARHYIGNSATAKDVTQRSYDSMQRVDCEVVRTNSADYPNVASLNACALGTTNADGTKDSITKYGYNTLGQVTSTTSGYATGLARLDSVSTYDIASATSTGNLSYVEDAKGNRTTFSYDGFNRLIKTCYALPATLHASSTTDCEQTLYRTTPVLGTTGAGTLVDKVRLRDYNSDATKVVTFGYDVMGRVSNKTGAVSETFTYNNFSQVLTHVNNTTGGASASETYTYNSLGWLLSDAQPMGTVTYAYDVFGKRSQMTYPGTGLYVAYQYNDGDELTAILENGATTISSFAYDDYGRRSALGRSSTYATAYGFDTSQRLKTVTNNTVDYPNTITLGYSAADQINSRAQSNAAFDPPIPGTSTTNYGVNGLNQMTSAGTPSLPYDLRGNMTSDGSVIYGYNANNLLTSVSAPTAATLVYDAENRLQTYTASGTTTKFLYDGVDLIAEYNASGTLQRRFVHGPGDDEPLVWYEGADTMTRRFFVADERGSIVAVTNSAGGVLAVNKYNEYGVPTTSNATYAGRFRYTGQVWLPEISLAYYKARIYAPTLGRFLQTDPIGYGDGMNWYAYVGNDPMNATDPSGLSWWWSSETTDDGYDEAPDWCGQNDSQGAEMWGLACGSSDSDSGNGGRQTLYGWVDYVSDKQLEEQRNLRDYQREYVDPKMNQQLGIYLGSVVGSGVVIGACVEVCPVVAARLGFIAKSGLTPNRIGQVIKWGTGRDAAISRTAQLTRAEVAAMRDAGLTKADVLKFRDIYKRAEFTIKKGGDVASARFDLMNKILRLWK